MVIIYSVKPNLGVELSNKYLKSNPEIELCAKCKHTRYDHINTHIKFPPWYLWFLFAWDTITDVDTECNYSDEFKHCVCSKFKSSGKFKRRS